ncbi:hypothetical protein ACM26V_03670 [Salipaludibacillus sp. HK11]|uniref:hypothetical protein n=1 Tax=Salipaludibacillus sp. HK11 TaxID=3394320 RepID=UPI0039FD21A0
MTFAIYVKDTMIGFIMMYHDTAEENEYGNKACYGVLRFMIDKKYQGNGMVRKQLQKHLVILRLFLKVNQKPFILPMSLKIKLRNNYMHHLDLKKQAKLMIQMR